MKNGISLLILVSLLASFSTSSYAVVIVNTDPSTTYNTTALTGFATTGAMMDGMAVTATFLDGSSETLTWGATGAASGGVTGTNWSLTESGDTFLNLWNLSSTAELAGLFIDAGVGNSVFDLTWPTEPGTLNSGSGTTFQAGTSSDITATYSGIVSVGSDPAVGDLWRYLNLDFTQGFSGSMSYLADTDNLLYAGDITPVPSVPEPGSLLLLGAGLLGLGLASRRKR